MHRQQPINTPQEWWKQKLNSVRKKHCEEVSLMLEWFESATFDDKKVNRKIKSLTKKQIDQNFLSCHCVASGETYNCANNPRDAMTSDCKQVDHGAHTAPWGVRICANPKPFGHAYINRQKRVHCNGLKRGVELYAILFWKFNRFSAVLSVIFKWLLLHILRLLLLLLAWLAFQWTRPS